MHKPVMTICEASLFLSAVSMPQNEPWRPVTGAGILRDFIDGLTAERTLAGDEIAKTEYVADGAGVLTEREASFPRTWEGWQ